MNWQPGMRVFCILRGADGIWRRHGPWKLRSIRGCGEYWMFVNGIVARAKDLCTTKQDARDLLATRQTNEIADLEARIAGSAY